MRLSSLEQILNENRYFHHKKLYLVERSEAEHLVKYKFQSEFFQSSLTIGLPIKQESFIQIGRNKIHVENIIAFMINNKIEMTIYEYILELFEKRINMPIYEFNNFIEKVQKSKLKLQSIS